MIQKFASLIVCIFFTQFAIAQSHGFNWAKGIGGSNDDAGTAIATDMVGNVYTIGTFRNTVDFDPGSGIFNLTSTGNQDIFILKTNSSGNFIWAKKIGGSVNESPNSIVADASGALYLTGFFAGNVDFDPGAGVFTMSTSGVGDNDIFMLKLDTAGNFNWAKQIGGSQADYGYGLALDAFNHIYISGSYRGSVDFDPSINSFPMTSVGNYDIFISKFDINGNFIWAKSMGGTGIDYSFSLALDPNGNIYSTGTYSGTADFDPSASTYNLTVAGSSSDEDIFILKLDTTGNLVWAKSIGGLNYDQGISLAVNATGVYTTGYFWGTADFNPGAGVYNLTAASADDIFISKLDTAGNFVWAKRMGSTSFNQGTCIKLDANSNVYTMGYFYGTVDFDPNTSSYNLSSMGSTDVFLSKLDQAGNFIWAKSYGGAGGESPSKFVIDNGGSIYSTGSFITTADFDPGAHVVNLTSFNTTYDDMYIQKLSECQPDNTSLTITACDSYVLNGLTYLASGSFTQVDENMNGCDSTIQLNLTILFSSSHSIVQSNCDSFVFNGITYTNSGSFSDTLTNAVGCDSIVNLYLTINHSNSANISVNGCDAVNINGQTYTTSGNYTQTLINSVGCDSVVNISVSIQSSSSSSSSQTACNSYVFNGQTYTTSGIYTQTFTNSVGCDSLANLNLTIHPSSSTTLTPTGCDSIIVNGQTYTASGTYTQLFTNAAGCDSILTLQIILNTVNTGVTQTGVTLTANASGASYQWVTCPSYTNISGATNQSYSSLLSGDFAVIVTQGGCSDTSSCYQVVVENTNDINQKNWFEVFPNPTSNKVVLHSEQLFENIKVMNVLNEVVMIKQVYPTHQIELDFSSFKQGIYFVMIDQQRMQKVIRN